MALKSKDLTALTYGNGFTLWHYRTTDSFADVTAAGYFDEAARMLRLGDFIAGNYDVDKPNARQAGLLVIVENADGKVEVSNLVTQFA